MAKLLIFRLLPIGGENVLMFLSGRFPALVLFILLRIYYPEKTNTMTIYRKQLTPEQALQKLRHYCGYQERCHSEVREKLYSLGVRKSEHDVIISTLIEEGYLNEERFAIAFAGGKFRQNQWGRNKIKYALRQKQVSDYCIKKALKQIDEKEYQAVLKKLADGKYDALKDEQWLLRKKKTMDYLLQKGFEMELVNKIVGNE